MVYLHCGGAAYTQQELDSLRNYLHGSGAAGRGAAVQILWVGKNTVTSDNNDNF